MSIAVLISDLPTVSAAYGPTAYVVAGAGAVSPRITHVAVAWSEGDLVVRLGRSSCGVIAENPHVSVLWAATEGEPMSLIVDGTVDRRPPADGGEVRIRPTSAVRHRDPLA